MGDLYGSLLPKDSISAWSSDVLKPSQDEKKKRTNSDMVSSNMEETVPSSTSTVKSHLAFKPMSIKRPPMTFKPTSVVSKPVNSTPKVETVQSSALVTSNIIAHVTADNASDDGEDYSNNTFEVSDPYDPSRPNDFNQYCIEREEKKRLLKLAEHNSVYIQEMETQRKEKESQRIAAAERGDVQKLQELDNSRGRGRGLSNLPAWMTNKTE